MRGGRGATCRPLSSSVSISTAASHSDSPAPRNGERSCNASLKPAPRDRHFPSPWASAPRVARDRPPRSPAPCHAGGRSPRAGPSSSTGAPFVARLLRGISVVSAGMHRQGFDLQLTQYDERGWRATFYSSGLKHSPNSATGSAFDPTPWHAVRVASSVGDSHHMPMVFRMLPMWSSMWPTRPSMMSCSAVMGGASVNTVPLFAS